MADETIGFDVQNGIGENAFALLSPYLGSIFPVVAAASAHTVKAGAAAGTVDVSAGTSYCFGVYRNISTITNLTIAPVTLAGAVRYDAVVKRFDWSTNSATILVVPGTAAVGAVAVAPANLFATPGDKYDQLLSLVKATNGSTSLEVLPRRIWGSKQFTVDTVDALPTATAAHKGVSFWVVDKGTTYRYSEPGGSPAWVADTPGIAELTGSAVLKTVQTGWAADAPHVNRCLVRPYSRHLDLEFRRSGSEINAANADGNFSDSPIVTLQDTCKPDRPTPVRVNYITTDGKEFGGDARLDPDGTLMLLGGAVARNLAQSTAVGFVSLRASIRFDRRTV